MKLFEAKLNKTNTGFLVGNKLTWADLFLYNNIDNLSSPIYQKKEEVLNNFPAIKKHFESISNLPGVAKYLAKRPVSEH
jgi:glutathione S-transferase